MVVSIILISQRAMASLSRLVSWHVSRSKRDVYPTQFLEPREKAIMARLSFGLSIYLCGVNSRSSSNSSGSVCVMNVVMLVGVSAGMTYVLSRLVSWYTISFWEIFVPCAKSPLDGAVGPRWSPHSNMEGSKCQRKRPHYPSQAWLKWPRPLPPCRCLDARGARIK